MTIDEAITWAKTVARIDPVKGQDQRCMETLAAEVIRLREDAKMYESLWDSYEGLTGQMRVCVQSSCKKLHERTVERIRYKQALRIIAGRSQCSDNLMSNQEIAVSVLDA